MFLKVFKSCIQRDWNKKKVTVIQIINGQNAVKNIHIWFKIRRKK